MDGDGKLDLAVANYDGNTVSLFRNKSVSGSITDSSFASKVDFTAGTTPHAVSIGDVNGDGKPDVAVANRSSNTVSVLRNKSDSGSITASSFDAKVDFTTGVYPSATTGDVDGDGRPDLAVTNWNGNAVSIFRNTVGQVTGVEVSLNQVPKKYSLSQNFPNPFNPSTSIEYVLAERSFTSLKIYNVLGEEVATLVSEVKSPGIHKAEWSADGFSSGVYFYRLQTRDFAQTRKLILLR